ncbi:MAG: TOBE domain-containing protein, partial [Polaromonas sp.]|nr:TOBE domain-containing protein [Gemmatimonadaceae bacterium]
VVTAAAARELELEVGVPVVASVKATAVHLC